MSKHRWSGWPGAWCLDCGIDDAGELCMAECPDALEKLELGEPCAIHKNGPCPEPGSKRHDPYSKP